MTSLPALHALRDALTPLTGPSRDVDAMIVATLNNAIVKPYPVTDDFGPRNKWQFWSIDGKHFLGSESRFPVPAYTRSLDEAEDLRREKLPELRLVIEHHKDGRSYVYEIDSDNDSYAPTEHLARLIVFVNALIARES